MTDKPETVADVRKPAGVIETHHADCETEWGYSFTSHNPDPADYIRCHSEADAWKLADRIERAMAASAVPVGEIYLKYVDVHHGPCHGIKMLNGVREEDLPAGTKLYAHAPPAVPVESLGREAAPYSAPFTTDVRNCCESPETCPEPCGVPPASVPDAVCPRCKGEKEGYLLDGDGPYLCNACYDTPPTTPEESP